MATSIHWTNETWNPLVGCSKISAGCARCYAAEAAKSARLQQFSQYQMVKDWDGTIAFVESQLLKPLSWRSPKKVFVCSMSDIFHAHVRDEWIDKIFAVMAIASQHTFQILTKRPERMRHYLQQGAKQRIRRGVVDLRRQLKLPPQRYEAYETCEFDWPLPNVWVGTSIENQEVVSQRIPHLLQTPAVVRFLSCEPLLESVDISTYISQGVLDTLICPTVNWVIIGGESGAKSRPCHSRWIESLVTQCQQQSVAVFVKQLGQNVFIDNALLGVSYKAKLKDRKGGDMAEWPESLRVRQFPIVQN